MSTVEMRSGTGTNECWQPPVWCAIDVTDESDFLLFGVGFSLCVIPSSRMLAQTTTSRPKLLRHR